MLSFKQYHHYLTVPLDEEHLVEWPWSNPAEKEKARLEKLRLLAKKGDLRAKKELYDLEHAAKVVAARSEREEGSKAEKWKAAATDAEARERGRSRAFDQETGSAGKIRQQMYHDKIWGQEPVRRS